MALGNITITIGAENYVFEPSHTQGSEVIRLDATHGNLGLPFSLTHDSQLGSLTKPDRRLVRVGVTRKDVASGEVASVTAHTVLTVPRSPAIVMADVVLAYNLLRTYLTTTVAESIAKGVLQ